MNSFIDNGLATNKHMLFDKLKKREKYTYDWESEF